MCIYAKGRKQFAQRLFPLTYLPFLILLNSLCLAAQSSLPLDDHLRLAQHQLEWHEPTDAANYRVRRGTGVNFLAYDFSVNFRADKLEVRYLFIPDDDAGDAPFIPHLRVPRMAMHLARNDDDSYLAAHAVDVAVLDSVYRADWGQSFVFSPKPLFSAAATCQMTAVYREGVGLLYTFLLFDEPPATLPERARLVRFAARKLFD